MKRDHPQGHTKTTLLAALAVAAALVLTSCGAGTSEGSSATAQAPETIPQPSNAQLVAAGIDGLPLAPLRDRVDLKAPTFTHPTEITNPLFPISKLRSVIFSGHVDHQPFHTETTLLPQTQVIEWSPGERVTARVSQYFAYVGGRIEEVAIDYYAQADDGSVWYFGEDVHDYDTGGQIDSTEGTWLAGRDGPPEMIMPAHPQPGDVHRAENIPAIAFEEVAIKKVDRTVTGPTGHVRGAMEARELHDDGTYSVKVFAPGYGEFFTSDPGELEAMALAIPADSETGPVPGELNRMSATADHALAAIEAGRWGAAAAQASAARRIWRAYSQQPQPRWLAAEMSRELSGLADATQHRREAAAATAAIDVGQSALDLKLRYLPAATIDRERLSLWASQMMIDAKAGDLGAVRGDVSTMEWIRDRFVATIPPAKRTAIDAHLIALRATVANGIRDLRGARAQAAELRRPLDLGPVNARD